MRRALYLFDIDGTLMRGGTEVHRASFAHAFRAVYGRDLSLDGIPAGGRTDTWLLAEPLRREGVPDGDIWERMPAAFDLMQRYVDENVGDLRDRVLPGVPQVLDGLRRDGHLLGLLTGNLSRIAVVKLRHAGLGRYFELGGFGEESEVRSRLVPVALDEAWRVTGERFEAGRCALVGDTPLDVEAGKAHGTKTVAVATGLSPYEALVESGADIVLRSFENVDASLDALLSVVGQ